MNIYEAICIAIIAYCVYDGYRVVQRIRRNMKKFKK